MSKEAINVRWGVRQGSNATVVWKLWHTIRPESVGLAPPFADARLTARLDRYKVYTCVLGSNVVRT
jgi:hypothetical protein